MYLDNPTYCKPRGPMIVKILYENLSSLNAAIWNLWLQLHIGRIQKLHCRSNFNIHCAFGSLLNTSILVPTESPTERNPR